MKTKLTLVSGSFYFLSTINLVRGQTSEVDLDTLTPEELESLKFSVLAGTLTSSEDLSAYKSSLDTVKRGEALPDPSTVEAETPKAPETVIPENITVIEDEEKKEKFLDKNKSEEDDEVEIPDEKDDITKDDIIKILKENKVQFKYSSSKDELFKLMQEEVK